MKRRETYWLDETDPQELRRRAAEFRDELMLGLAQQLEDRAEHIANLIARQAARAEGSP